MRALVIMWGPLGINEQDFLGSPHFVDRVTKIYVCVPNTSLQVDLLQSFLRDRPFKQVSSIVILAVTLHLQGLELCQELIDSLVWSLS